MHGHGKVQVRRTQHAFSPQLIICPLLLLFQPPETSLSCLFLSEAAGTLWLLIKRTNGSEIFLLAFVKTNVKNFSEVDTLISETFFYRLLQIGV